MHFMGLRITGNDNAVLILGHTDHFRLETDRDLRLGPFQRRFGYLRGMNGEYIRGHFLVAVFPLLNGGFEIFIHGFRQKHFQSVPIALGKGNDNCLIGGLGPLDKGGLVERLVFLPNLVQRPHQRSAGKGAVLRRL